MARCALGLGGPGPRRAGLRRAPSPARSSSSRRAAAGRHRPLGRRGLRRRRQGKPKPAKRAATSAMKGKAFTPHVVVVPVGGTVEFPNEDPIFHNVFSVSGENRFDLDLYKRPKSGSLDLPAPRRRAGLLQHPSADERGRRGARQPLLRQGARRTAPSRSRACPPGKYTLKAWHERGGEAAVEVVVPGGGRGRRPAHARRLELQARASTRTSSARTTPRSRPSKY